MNALAAAASFVSAATAAGKISSCCNSARKWTGDFDARRGQQVVHKYRELRIAVDDRRDDLCRYGLHDGLGLHRLIDAEAFEQFQDIGTGRAGRQKGDGFCVEQGLLEGFGRADIGLGRAGAHRYPVADARDFNGRSELGPRGGVLEDIDRDDAEVERLAGGRELDQVGSCVEMNDELMSGDALELQGRVRSARRSLSRRQAPSIQRRAGRPSATARTPASRSLRPAKAFS